MVVTYDIQWNHQFLVWYIWPFLIIIKRRRGGRRRRKSEKEKRKKKKGIIHTTI